MQSKLFKILWIVIAAIPLFGWVLPTLFSHKSYEGPILGSVIIICILVAVIRSIHKKEINNV